MASDAEVCIGAGVCASVVPSRFRIDDGFSVPIDPVIEADEEVLVAANLCPMAAIRVTDLSTGAVLAPDED
ncbi:ferredoxin [Micromonospora sp. WMMD980]|uniref:ferredoxin n=1 Tax=Micromonospora sp. WMMD980 TaxID=3016088 RepID=UPI0024166BBD|nr:ferredoxin [Micromonospora sp. WMMD980]MDG4800222.1 ferredoxin [Micromonospora sp. WMMD980]